MYAIVAGEDYHDTSLSTWKTPGLLPLRCLSRNILDDSTVKTPKKQEAEYIFASPHLAPISAHGISADSESICMLVLPLCVLLGYWAQLGCEQ